MVNTIQEINHLRTAGKTEATETKGTLDERIEYALLNTKKEDYPQTTFDWKQTRHLHDGDTIRKTLYEYQNKGWTVYWRHELYEITEEPKDDDLTITVSAGKYMPWNWGPDDRYRPSVTYSKYTGNHD